MDDFEVSHGIEFRRRFLDLGLVSSGRQMQTLVLDTFRLEVSRQLCEEWLKGPGAVSSLAPSRGCTVLYDRYRDKLLRWHFVVQGMFLLLSVACLLHAGCFPFDLFWFHFVHLLLTFSLLCAAFSLLVECLC